MDFIKSSSFVIGKSLVVIVCMKKSDVCIWGNNVCEICVSNFFIHQSRKLIFYGNVPY